MTEKWKLDAVYLDGAQRVLLQEVHDGLRAIVELEAEAAVNDEAGVKAAGLHRYSPGLEGRAPNNIIQIFLVSSAADPGCLSRIRNFSIPDPGSNNNK